MEQEQIGHDHSRQDEKLGQSWKQQEEMYQAKIPKIAARHSNGHTSSTLGGRDNAWIKHNTNRQMIFDSFNTRR
jgi:fructose-1-phosphate kinase PfkB-like protein